MIIAIRECTYSKFSINIVNIKKANLFISWDSGEYYIFNIDNPEKYSKLIFNYPLHKYYSSREINNYKDILEEEDEYYLYARFHNETIQFIEN